MEKKFEYIVEDSFRLGEKAKFKTGIDKIRYIPINPVEGTSLNNGEKIIFTKSKSDAWLQPSKSYLYMEMKLVKADGTPYTNSNNGEYPDITLINNGPMYLFKDISYSLDDLEIEKFTNPGYVTLMHGLMTKSSSFTGLEQFWSPDTYDGSTTKYILFYPMDEFTNTDIPFTGGVDKDNFRDAMKLIIPRFNTVNNTTLPNLIDDDIPCVGAAPTINEVKAAFKNLIDKINTNIIATFKIPYLRDADFPGLTAANVLGSINAAIKKINAAVTTANEYFDKNRGFLTRKRIPFNPLLNVQPISNAGNFTVIIPLSFIFNFCSDFDELITSRKHDLYLQREVLDTDAILRNDGVDPGKVIISKMVWFMPQIYPTTTGALLLNERILSMTSTDIPYREKNVKVITVIPGDSSFQATLSFAGGIKRPRYLICGFQFTPAGVERDKINFAIFNNPLLATENMINVTDATIYIDSEPNPIGYTNDFTLHRDAKWYFDYKSARATLTGDMDESNCIDYFNFVNLYRLYVFDTKERINFSSGAATITIDFKFKSVIPPTTDGVTKLYVLSYSDNIVSLPNDGLDILKKIM